MVQNQITMSMSYHCYLTVGMDTSMTVLHTIDSLL